MKRVFCQEQIIFKGELCDIETVLFLEPEKDSVSYGRGKVGAREQKGKCELERDGKVK